MASRGGVRGRTALRQAGLVRVDLAALTSRYIGETEKHLDAIFADAEASGAALLFDEADALFGKRAETAGARDRRVDHTRARLRAHLLARLRRFRGRVIFTARRRGSIDPAWARRLAAPPARANARRASFSVHAARGR